MYVATSQIIHALSNLNTHQCYMNRPNLIKTTK